MLKNSIVNEPTLDFIDIVFWQYETSINPFANLFALINRQKRVGSIEETTNCLRTFIEKMHYDENYTQIIIVGHSLGGLLGVFAANDIASSNSDTLIKKICLLASPQNTPTLARIVSPFSFFNPQIKYLANKNKMNSQFHSYLPSIRKLGVLVAYMRYSRDEVLSECDIGEFDRYFTYDIQHSWFKEGRQTSPEYSDIVTWLEGEKDE